MPEKLGVKIKNQVKMYPQKYIGQKLYWLVCLCAGCTAILCEAASTLPPKQAMISLR